MEEEQQQFTYFDDNKLAHLINKMGYSDQSIFLESGSKELVCEVANDFINQLLEMSFQQARSKPARQVTTQDLGFILAQKFKIPTANVETE